LLRQSLQQRSACLHIRANQAMQIARQIKR